METRIWDFCIFYLPWRCQGPHGCLFYPSLATLHWHKDNLDIWWQTELTHTLQGLNAWTWPEQEPCFILWYSKEFSASPHQNSLHPGQQSKHSYMRTKSGSHKSICRWLSKLSLIFLIPDLLLLVSYKWDGW